MRPIQRPIISKRKFEDEEDLTNYRRVRLRVSQAKTLSWNEWSALATKTIAYSKLYLLSKFLESVGVGWGVESDEEMRRGSCWVGYGTME